MIDNATVGAPFFIHEEDVSALTRAEQGDPFSVLGMHPVSAGECGRQWVVRAYLPGALAVELLDASDGRVLAEMQQLRDVGLFVASLSAPLRYRFRIQWTETVTESEDPYSFGSLLADMDLHLIAAGQHHYLAHCLGAQVMTAEHIAGVRFAVWAPNARRVSVVGDFNGWDGRRHPMRLRHRGGIWELFIPRLGPGAIYKYELLGPRGLLPLRADPLALCTEKPPATASVVAAPLSFQWRDQVWMDGRAQRHAPGAPISIYEVHAGSWRRADCRDRDCQWDELARQLIPYVRGMGFTHIELMPIMEHPFGGSWGYQVLSQFAPSARYGSRSEFAAFVDACHRAEIGVILDWVPAHFPTDAHGLAHFDGTALFEYEHPFEGFHQDWKTHIYNLGRHEVAGFILASALHWLREFHIDGLRVDAVASMLYRDYSRRRDEWIPNVHGGRENLEAITFLRRLTEVVHSECPGTVVIAEESTAFPGVSHPSGEGGLGFSYKWNMGWMHDSLRYMTEDPVNRRHHHHQLTFGLLYAFNEKFILPISHDEVVYGKGSLLNKMPGDTWQKFANLRLYLAFMWTHPGKKLLFMGTEFGVWKEWDHDGQLDWKLLEKPPHQGVRHLLAKLNELYRSAPALHRLDCEGSGFRWLIGDDDQNSVYAWLRSDGAGTPWLIVHNFTPVPREHYCVGVPKGGHWSVLLNTDDAGYGGTGAGSTGGVEAEHRSRHGEPWSLTLVLPPLGSLILARREAGGRRAV